MTNPSSLQLRVGIDVGSRCHSVAIGLSDGSLLEEFEIPHTASRFQDFFKRVEASAQPHAAPIAVAMEGYNGHVRPLDSLVKANRHQGCGTWTGLLLEATYQLSQNGRLREISKV